MAVVKAHDQKVTIHLMTHVPEHEPRTSDPHYKIFNATKKRMKKLGLMKCAIPDCTFPGPIELHHDKVEFSAQAGVDINLFNLAYGLHLKDEEEFKQYIEGPGNLEALCPVHHRTHLGIHVLPTPFWSELRIWKHGLLVPAEAIAA